MLPGHSELFIAVRDKILALEHDRDRARLAAMFGYMTVPHRKLGVLRETLRAIAELDDADLERLAKWFSTWMNAWGQTPRATGLRYSPGPRYDQLKDQ